jgi:hypothetical protein
MTLKIGSPRELVASIPAQMGFFPQSSIVLIFLREGRIALTARVDEEYGLEDVFLTDMIIKQSIAHGFDTYAAVYFGEKLDRFQALTDKLVELMDVVPTSPRLMDSLHVDSRNNYASLVCEDGYDCSGTLDEQDYQSSPLAAGVVANGTPILKSREDLMDEIVLAKTKTKAYREAEAFVIEMSETSADRAAYVWRAYDFATDVLTEMSPDEKSLIAVGIMMEDYKLRDGILKFLCSIEDTRDIQFNTVSVLPKVSPKKAVPLVTLAAIASFLAGDGARANIALDVALKYEPNYNMAKLMERAVNNGFSPQMWREMMEGLTVEDCLGVAR